MFVLKILKFKWILCNRYFWQQLTPSVRWPVWGTGSRRSLLKLPGWCCCSPETETNLLHLCSDITSRHRLCSFIVFSSKAHVLDVSGDHHLHEARDVPESSQRAVRTQHVCCDDDAAGELHAKHRCPGDHRVTGKKRREHKTVKSTGSHLLTCSTPSNVKILRLFSGRQTKTGTFIKLSDISILIILSFGECHLKSKSYKGLNFISTGKQCVLLLQQQLWYVDKYPTGVHWLLRHDLTVLCIWAAVNCASLFVFNLFRVVGDV